MGRTVDTLTAWSHLTSMARIRSGSPSVAIGYIRVSTEEQKLGPEAQRAQIADYAARNGLTVAFWAYDQGVSGATPIEGRTGLLSALSALREHGAGVLLVAKRDRIARDVVIAATVERVAQKAGARLVSADGTGNGDSPADAFMRTVIDGAAAYERDLIRSRTRAALAAKRARNEKTGGECPYGYQLAQDGIRLEPCQDEQATIGAIRQLRAEGLSVRAIAAELGSRGIVGRTGRALSHTQVHRIVAA